ncbi:hypothetical protein [Haladaptatus sp. DYF46]|uniref:hypothetical protein n=1 Tax=Haladaptatus sp. DYF46 TaxID=2886041 RepID=UPI001E4225D9|nr:hypothetical protein [Haladaptatus sp. DYF46]
MNRLLRYAIALLVGATVTGGVAFFQPHSAESTILLAGIAVVFPVEVAIALPYWSVLRGTTTERPNWVNGAFTGASTFGCLMLLNGTKPTPNFATMVLGFGLAWLGFVAGIAFGVERKPSV